MIEFVAETRQRRLARAMAVPLAALVTLGVFVKLLKAGRINKDESTVVCITGQGLKTLDPLYAPGVLPVAPIIKPTLAAFKDLKLG